MIALPPDGTRSGKQQSIASILATALALAAGLTAPDVHAATDAKA